MSNIRKLNDILTWVQHGEQYVDRLHGNLTAVVKEAYCAIRAAVKQEMTNLPELDGLVKSMKIMQQQGSNPYNGYERSVLIDRSRELRQGLWIQRCNYLNALKAQERTLSAKLRHSLDVRANDWPALTRLRGELDAVRGKITAVEEGEGKTFFKQSMINEAIDLNKFYAGEW